MACHVMDFGLGAMPTAAVGMHRRGKHGHASVDHGTRNSWRDRLLALPPPFRAGLASGRLASRRIASNAWILGRIDAGCPATRRSAVISSPGRCAMMADSLPRVVIVGGGFGGLNAAQKLAGEPVQITLLDRRNHHLFQPLLYQVATAGLSPSDIATPIRRVLRHQKNVEVLLVEATSVDLQRKVVASDDGEFPYDI